MGLQVRGNLSLIVIDSHLICSFRFLFANICPCLFYYWDLSFIQRLDIWFSKFKKHSPIQFMAVYLFDTSLHHYFLLQSLHLFNELNSQRAFWEFYQVLKIFFLFSWTNQSATITLLEEVCKHPSYSILLLYGFRTTFLFSKSLFQILFRCNPVSF